MAGRPRAGAAPPTHRGEMARAPLLWVVEEHAFPGGGAPYSSVVSSGMRPLPFTVQHVPSRKPIKASIVCEVEKTHFRKPSVFCAWCGTSPQARSTKNRLPC